MARILLGWEIGAGFGHVAHLVPVARALAAQGHEVVLVLRDVVSTWPMLRATGLPVLQAPTLPPRPLFSGGRPFQARSYADILAFQGFDNVDVLEPVARAWRDLVDLVAPDLVIAEHAPTLCVACHGRVPVINIGTGFTVPCLKDGVFPPLNASVPETVPAARVEGVIRELLARLGQEAPAQPMQVALGDESLVLTFGVIDPYRGLRTLRAIGPLEPMPPAVPLPATPACFVYLPADHPHLKPLLAGLARTPVPGIVYVRGASPQLLGALQRTPLTVVTRPVDLDEVLPRTSVVLHHGGAGITQRCLAWGRPQIVAPIWLEQALTAEALVRTGAALRLDGPAAAERSGELLGRVVQDRRMADAAQGFAAALRSRFPGNALDQVVARIGARLGQVAPATQATLH